MTEATAIASPVDPTLFDLDEEDAVSRWSGIVEDLRFFLICYLAGLVVFLVMLS